MQAIILCAGCGQRLGVNVPKCLLQINRQTILESIVKTLSCIESLKEIIVVTGFRQELVNQEIDQIVQRYPIAIRSVFNSEFQDSGIVRSLQAASLFITKSNVIRISGDIYFNDQNSFIDIVDSPISVLGTKQIVYTATSGIPYLNLHDNQISKISLIKEQQKFNMFRQWLDCGMYRHDDFMKMMEASHLFVDKNNYHFELLNYMIERGMQFGFMDLEGLFEIDTLEDLINVRKSL